MKQNLEHSFWTLIEENKTIFLIIKTIENGHFQFILCDLLNGNPHFGVLHVLFCNHLPSIMNPQNVPFLDTDES